MVAPCINNIYSATTQTCFGVLLFLSLHLFCTLALDALDNVKRGYANLKYLSKRSFESFFVNNFVFCVFSMYACCSFEHKYALKIDHIYTCNVCYHFFLSFVI